MQSQRPCVSVHPANAVKAVKPAGLVFDKPFGCRSQFRQAIGTSGLVEVMKHGLSLLELAMGSSGERSKWDCLGRSKDKGTRRVGSRGRRGSNAGQTSQLITLEVPTIRTLADYLKGNTPVFFQACFMVYSLQNHGTICKGLYLITQHQQLTSPRVLKTNPTRDRYYYVIIH